MVRLAVLFLLLVPFEAMADTVVALRTIRAQDVVTADSITLKSETLVGAYDHIDDVVGQEAKVTLYPNRPILHGHLGPPALVERNQIVELVFEKNGLRITSEGRSLARAAAGERVRAMNISSKTSLFGTVLENGSIRVSQ